MHWITDGTPSQIVAEAHTPEDTPRLINEAVQELLDQGGEVLEQDERHAIVRVTVDWLIEDADSRVQKRAGKVLDKDRPLF